MVQNSSIITFSDSNLIFCFSALPMTSYIRASNHPYPDDFFSVSYHPCQDNVSVIVNPKCEMKEKLIHQQNLKDVTFPSNC
ncbi:hypothetical protein P8452_07179 [Trifolium repens]|nr:hypothetical protein P8452_07179 [Trifolium repens]